MAKYFWRKNFSGKALDDKYVVLGKIAVKTQETFWVGTEAPAIVLISLHSHFHEGLEGSLKMHALISTIRDNVKGSITILLADHAHLQTLSLKHDSNVQKTIEECSRNALFLAEKFKSCFEACIIAFWHSYINQDSNYLEALEYVKKLLFTDPVFKNLLYEDAETCYTHQRREEYADKQLFMDKTIEDLLEQCACILVLSKKGYRYQFYPGNSYLSTDYANRTLLTVPVHWISVFLSIEKKTVLNLSDQLQTG